MSLLRIPTLPEEIQAPDTPLLESTGEIAVLMQQSKYDEAFAKFQPLLKDHPDTPFLHYSFGTALAVLSRYDAAEEQMKMESKISPRSELPWVSLASIELREHRPAEALGFAQQALDLAPNSAEARRIYSDAPSLTSVTRIWPFGNSKPPERSRRPARKFISIWQRRTQRQINRKKQRLRACDVCSFKCTGREATRLCGKSNLHRSARRHRPFHSAIRRQRRRRETELIVTHQLASSSLANFLGDLFDLLRLLDDVHGQC